MKSAKHLLGGFLLLVVLLFGFGCTEEEPAGPGAVPQMSVSVTSLDFGTSDVIKSFTITNSGDGSLQWTITDDAAWLTVSPTSGTNNADETDVVTVTVERAGVSEGDHTATITIDPNEGNNHTIGVTMSVGPPILVVSTDTLDFGADEDILTFEIRNAGGGTLNWTATGNPDWLTLSPTSGQTTAGADIVTLTVDRDTVLGHYEAAVSVDAGTAGQGDILVMMNVGERIWFYNITDANNLDLTWLTFDNEADNGDDYWGIAAGQGQNAAHSVWCNGVGDHPTGRYDDHMDAWMVLRQEKAVAIQNHSDIVVRFSVRYETEAFVDYFSFIAQGSEGTWYYLNPETHWSGGDFQWGAKVIDMSYFDNPPLPTDALRFGFHFSSDFSIGGRGAYVDQLIEVWGRPR